jgi:uncharacterized protein YdaU (DUF1376 family)
MARPWYAHYTADYERKTSHLTMLEDGAYRRMLDHYYATGIALPLNADHLYRICRAFSDEERNAIDSVLKQYFVRKRDGYHNNRADEEIAEAEKRIKNKTEAGRAGGIAARGKSGRKRIADVIADELQENTHSQSHTHTQKKKEETRSLRERSPRKSKTAIPDNFPDDDARRRAQEVWSKKGRPDLAASVLDEIQAFRDHHLATGKTSGDWPASWRTWVKNAPKFTPQERANGHARRESPHIQADRIARELLEEFNARDTPTNPDARSRPGVVVLREGLGGRPADSSVAPDVRRLVGPNRG